MTQPLNFGNLCGPSTPGIRRISLPDGDQVGLIGLDAVLHAMLKEGKPPEISTAKEMIVRLREKNYIGAGQAVEELYEKALLSEYQRFYERKVVAASRRVK